MTTYPETLPPPQMAGFAMSVASGVIRSESPSHQEQRRVFTTMPHRFTMRFIMDVDQWADWVQWINEYGHRWFTIDLPTMYAGRAGLSKAPVLIRLIGDVPAAAVSADHVQITVEAEMAPSAAAELLRYQP